MNTCETRMNTRLGHLSRANAATRALRAQGLRVIGVDIAGTPRLMLDRAPGADLPMRGLTRTRAAQGYTCCALFEGGVALEWREAA